MSLDMDIAGESICVLSQRCTEQIAAISSGAQMSANLYGTSSWDRRSVGKAKQKHTFMCLREWPPSSSLKQT